MPNFLAKTARSIPAARTLRKPDHANNLGFRQDELSENPTTGTGSCYGWKEPILPGKPIVGHVAEIEQRPSLQQRLLGAFVCLQLVAIPLGSYIKLVPIRALEHHGEINGDLQEKLPPDKWAKAREPMQTIFDSIAFVSSRWGEVSGQAQSWALFASFGKHAAMPAVELHWSAETGMQPLTLKCHFEPADPTHYFYPPEPSCRRYNYEYRTCIFYWVALPSYFKTPEEYRIAVMENVRDMNRSMTAFLKWRMNAYLKDHPGTPMPERVVLKARILPNPAPGESRLDRPASYEIPVAQWRPGQSPIDGNLPIEAWDPSAHTFVAIKPREGS